MAAKNARTTVAGPVPDVEAAEAGAAPMWVPLEKMKPNAIAPASTKAEHNVNRHLRPTKGFCLRIAGGGWALVKVFLGRLTVVLKVPALMEVLLARGG